MGTAAVRVIPEQGNELLGFPLEAAGEFIFSGIDAGKYVIVIGAPGFQDLQISTQLEGGPRQKSLFVPMRQSSASAIQTSLMELKSAPPTAGAAEPKPAAEPPSGQPSQGTPHADGGPNATTEQAQEHAAAPGDTIELKLEGAEPLPETAPAPPPPSQPSTSPATPSSPAKSNFVAEAPAAAPGGETAASPAHAPGQPDYWNPKELEIMPPVDPNVSCPADAILKGVGNRMSELVDTLEKFTATENLEHYPVDKFGAMKGPEKRSFAYVVSVKQNLLGTFVLEEYRDGGIDTEVFPAHTATRGSPAMALIFHPVLAGGFDFRCEGMGQLRGRQVWQIHFAQRADKPIQIRSYTVNNRSFGVALEGRVWVDPGNNQVLRLESELMSPIQPIELTREHFSIDYKPVKFRSTGQQLWLPETAELYVERKGKRFYRRHTFSDFRLFNVESAQNIRPPGESFSFSNSTDRDVIGRLTVTRREGVEGNPVILRFVVPAHGRVFKIVGPGKDVNMVVAEVGAATFEHEGDAGAVKVDAHLTKEASLDVVAQTKVPLTQLALPPITAAGSQP
jgi:hypothetical protein